MKGEFSDHGVAASHYLRRSLPALAYRLRPGRMAVAGLVLAILVSLALVAFASSGNLDSFPRAAKSLVIPGVFCLYVVGSITGSVIGAYAAFLLGMLAVYGSVGTIGDWLGRLWIHQRTRRETK